MGPRRIVCLTEETTELLYLLGEEDRIVGISAYTVRPARARTEKPIVSAFINGSVPKISALQPDLVVGFSDIQADLAADLIRAGLNVLILNQRSLAEILDATLLIGGLVGKAREAAALVAQWKHRIEKSQSANSEGGVRVFFQEWDSPCISGIRWVSELISVAGGQDVFAERARQSMAKDRIVSIEEVLAADPQVIIGSWCGKPMDESWVRHNFAGTSAVRENRIFEIDSAVILQPGPALFLEGLNQIERCLTNGSV